MEFHPDQRSEPGTPSSVTSGASEGVRLAEEDGEEVEAG